MAAKVGDVVFQAGEGVSLDDFWDDSALIKAYEKAVNSFKYGSGADSGDNSTDKKKNRRKRKKNKKQMKDACDEFDDSSSNKWHLGDLCQAIFSEDELIYNAEIIEIYQHSNTCVVRYTDYGNEEEQFLTDLLPPTEKAHTGNYVNIEENATINTTVQNGSDHSEANRSSHCGLEWCISDLCIAPELPHQHLHEAVINSFPSQYTCKVTFIKSRKSQEVNIQELRNSENYHSHSADSYHPTNEIFNPPHLPFFHPGPFMGNLPHYPFQSPPYLGTPFGKRWNTPINTQEQRTSSKGILPPPIPPPPPPMSLGDLGDDESLASMLMSWYLSGYHTGYFKAVQQFRNGNDGGKSNTKHEPPPFQPTTSEKATETNMDTKE